MIKARIDEAVQNLQERIQYAVAQCEELTGQINEWQGELDLLSVIARDMDRDVEQEDALDATLAALKSAGVL